MQLGSYLTFRFSDDGFTVIAVFKAKGELTDMALAAFVIVNGFVTVADWF